MLNSLKIIERLKNVYQKVRSSHLLQRQYENSGAKLIYESNIGVSVSVHPEKLVDIIKSDSSCDAEEWIRKLEDNLSSLDVVLDVGANIGIVSCWLSKRARHVYAFEPVVENIEHLQKNIELNSCSNIEIIDSAVGEKCGTVDLYRRSAFGHHGTTAKHVTGTLDIRRVRAITLDSFCDERSIDRVSFLKIDVEGAEISVLEGFERFLSQSRVDMILFEHAPVLFENDEQKTAVFDFLTERNYLVFDVCHNQVSRMAMREMSQGDFYAKPIKKLF